MAEYKRSDCMMCRYEFPQKCARHETPKSTISHMLGRNAPYKGLNYVDGGGVVHKIVGSFYTKSWTDDDDVNVTIVCLHEPTMTKSRREMTTAKLEDNILWNDDATFRAIFEDLDNSFRDKLG